MFRLISPVAQKKSRGNNSLARAAKLTQKQIGVMPRV